MPTVLVLARRRWLCPELLCELRTWSEHVDQIALRASLTERARRRLADMVNIDGFSIAGRRSSAASAGMLPTQRSPTTPTPFTQSRELGEVMHKVGVLSPPEIQWLQPIRHDIVSDRQLPAFLLRHHVADVDTWLASYDAASELQQSAGIIGHGANRSLDDPSLIIVYHQAETFDALHSLLADPHLQTAMHEAGVTSEPEVTFHTGGWAKTY